MIVVKIAEIMFFVQEATLSEQVLTPFVIQTDVPTDLHLGISHRVFAWNDRLAFVLVVNKLLRLS